MQRRWREAGASDIWVQPLIGKQNGIVVLLPKRRNLFSTAERSVVVASANGRQAEVVQAGEEHTLQFVATGKWRVSVYCDGNDGARHLEREFEGYDPRPYS